LNQSDIRYRISDIRYLIGLLLLIPSLASAEAVCSRSNITLRKGPGPQNAVTWRVPKNMPFLRLERKNGWTKVQDLEGEIHWAKSGDLTTKIRCVVVKTNVALIHKEPSMTAPNSDLKTLDRYTPLERINDNRDWLQVKDEAGHLAWIHESQVWKPVTVNAFTF
jgi:SH3-like domain-containing protein